MYTEYDVYVIYRRAQANHFDRGYRLPKNWEYHWNEKLNKTARDNLTTLTNYFNTKWSNINLDKYMECGFEIFKSFTYKNFLDKKIVKKYIAKDKNEKREIEVTKRKLVNDIKHVSSGVEGNVISEKLRIYCSLWDGSTRQVIEDYLHNKIDAVFVVFLVKYGYMELSEFEMSLVPYIRENILKITTELDYIKEFLEKILRR